MLKVPISQTENDAATDCRHRSSERLQAAPHSLDLRLAPTQSSLNWWQRRFSCYETDSATPGKKRKGESHIIRWSSSWKSE